MAMDKSAADAFVYAKASGMLARSFVGERAQTLFSVRTLQELWSLLFAKEVPVVPETMLAKALEQEAQNHFIAEYKKLVQNYARPEPLLISLLTFFDYDNLKELGAALCMHESAMPVVQDISPYNLIDYGKWPDIAAMTAKGPLAWYDTVPALSEQQQNDYRLDCQYIAEVWANAKAVDASCRNAVLGLLGEKFRMENVLWALRLRVYYGMGRKDVLEHLAYASGERHLHDTLVKDAVATLDWELDTYERWRSWKYHALLNPSEEGVPWMIDPRWISHSFKRLYVQKAYRLFHQFPFTACPLVCWFIVKRDELDNIRTASEMLRLHVQHTEEVFNG